MIADTETKEKMRELSEFIDEARGMHSNPLLISEPPLQVLPSLAVLIGLDESIALQQMHYRCRHSTKIEDGFRWCFDTYEDWAKNCFPFWSERTIRRVFQSLEKQGLIVSATFNKTKFDRTKWYRPNYALVDGLATKRAHDAAKTRASMRPEDAHHMRPKHAHLTKDKTTIPKELELEGEATKRAEQKTPDPRVGPIMDFFSDQHLSVFKERPKLNGKDGAILKKLLASDGEEKIKAKAYALTILAAESQAKGWKPKPVTPSTLVFLWNELKAGEPAQKKEPERMGYQDRTFGKADPVTGKRTFQLPKVEIQTASGRPEF